MQVMARQESDAALTAADRALAAGLAHGELPIAAFTRSAGVELAAALREWRPLPAVLVPPTGIVLEDDRSAGTCSRRVYEARHGPVVVVHSWR